MDLLEQKFQELRERGEGAHMAHVYYGDPSEEFSLKLIETLLDNGADIIEFGIPFSDPIADGPVFQRACERSLRAGVTPPKCIEAIRKLRCNRIEAPIIVTTYFNIPYVMGFEKFLEKIRSAGAQGILIPDLPVEEAGPYIKLASKNGLHIILQVAPTTSLQRLNRILKAASGFIYLVSLEGVTGARLEKTSATFRLIRIVKLQSTIPVIVGFGISKREHAETMIIAGADGVVVGSAYTKIYMKHLENPHLKLHEIAKLANEIKKGCINGYKTKNFQYANKANIRR
jgi:tryptophan synthase alpha chain